jgi:hypothetical protein
MQKALADILALIYEFITWKCRKLSSFFFRSRCSAPCIQQGTMIFVVDLEHIYCITKLKQQNRYPIAVIHSLANHLARQAWGYYY